MENDKFFPNGGGPNPLGFVGMASSCSSSGMDIQLGELNCGSDQLPNCFLNLNWENSMIQQQQQQQQSLPFESALSSMVSSPAAASNSSAAVPADSVVIRELIGKLGSICNSGEISPQSHTLASYNANNSCYSTPLNSPPKLNLSMMDHHQVRGNLPVSGNSIPPHPSLAPFPADPGFAERAARFSCFGTGNYGGLNGQFRLNETELPNRSSPNLENGKLSRVSSNQSLKAAAGSQMGGQESKEFPFQDGIEMDMRSGSASASASDRKFTRFSRSSTPEDAEFGNAHEESSASEVIPSGETNLKVPNEGNARKRKAATKGKAKDFPSSSSVNETKISQDDDSNAKRCKSANDGNEKGGEVKAKVEPNGSGNTGGDGAQKQTKDNSKPPEPLKDYIHVRARRGQATDSHSLAERVRREKISERMKFLQDLVPGCNKVTGKAVMLDEIINYVQSLQRQVEFLSMKLATVNPRLDFNVDSLLSKDILHSRGSFPHPIYPMDSSASAFHYGHQPQQGLPLQSGISDGAETQCSINPLDSMLRRSLSMQLPPLDGFGDAASQLAAFWEDDLQSVVQMGFGGPNQTKETAFQSQSFHGSLPMTNMKVEL